MDTFKAFKSFSIIILAVLLFLNIGFFIANQSAETTSGQTLEQSRDMRQLEETNERLKTQQEFQTKSEREEAYKALEEQAMRFVHLAFEQNVDEYQTRKNEAPEVMNEELKERFFPAEMYGQGEVETSVSQEEFFIRNGDINQEEMDIIIKLNHDIRYIEREVEETSNVIIRVTFKHENGEWIASEMIEMK
ncbi:hypothetical protein ABC345_20980 [Shouchella sp. 1P09AA]|uniref:hypothetical protein n=1 Tax=unclassified Shouchella TaxID=2893065 RepID=UPI0039A2BEE3